MILEFESEISDISIVAGDMFKSVFKMKDIGHISIFHIILKWRQEIRYNDNEILMQRTSVIEYKCVAHYCVESDKLSKENAEQLLLCGAKKTMFSYDGSVSLSSLTPSIERIFLGAPTTAEINFLKNKINFR